MVRGSMSLPIERGFTLAVIVIVAGNPSIAVVPK